MALQNTNLFIQMPPLPATFRGTPQQLAEAIAKRLKIVSPLGITSIVVGDSEPTSNQGPWLKGGTKWYVFDTALARYVPVDTSDSVIEPFQIGDTVPETSTPSVWLRTSNSQPVSWYFFNGLAWVPDANVVLSGPTYTRPTTPVNLQQYYDSDISCLIWYERNAWRTVSGSPGDVKFVTHETLTEALTANPGWSLLGESQTAWRGRLISQATKDSGASPETILTVPAGVAQRAAHETYGETDGVSLDSLSPVPYPPTISLYCLVKD